MHPRARCLGPDACLRALARIGRATTNRAVLTYLAKTLKSQHPARDVAGQPAGPAHPITVSGPARSVVDSPMAAARNAADMHATAVTSVHRSREADRVDLGANQSPQARDATRALPGIL